MMNPAIRRIAEWARENGWRVEDTASGYSQFFTPAGDYVFTYPATPSNPRRRLAALTVTLRRHGLPLPPPSKKERRARRKG